MGEDERIHAAGGNPRYDTVNTRRDVIGGFTTRRSVMPHEPVGPTQLADLRCGHAFDLTIVPLKEVGVIVGVWKPGEARCLASARQRAGEHVSEAVPAQLRAQLRRARPASVRQRHVEAAAVQTGERPLGLSMTHERQAAEALGGAHYRSVRRPRSARFPRELAAVKGPPLGAPASIVYHRTVWSISRITRNYRPSLAR